MEPYLDGADGAVFRTEYLREVTGDDDGLFRKFVEVFLQNSPSVVAQITEAHAHNDLEALVRAAHTLAGSAGSFGAERLRLAAMALEAALREGRPQDAAPLVARVLREWNDLRAEIDRVMKG